MRTRSLSSTHSVSRLFTSVGLAAALVVTAISGCSGGDDEADTGPTGPVCGNGKIEGTEACDGADIGAAACTALGFDGGPIGCMADCMVDSSTCEYYDTDGDGLKTDAEQAAGTDPANPDSDLDGFTDGEELTAATDPLSLDSWPLAMQRFPNRLAQWDAAGISSTGWDPGDIARNIDLTDQYGTPLEFHQFYGYNVVLSVGARWCGPCNEAAQGSQELWSAYADKGVIFVELLLDGTTPGKAATQSDIDYWANKYDILFPVTWRSGSGASILTAVSALPTFIFIDREMKVTNWIEGFPGDSAIENEVDGML